jgi:hypothetical protein
VLPFGVVLVLGNSADAHCAVAQAQSLMSQVKSQSQVKTCAALCRGRWERFQSRLLSSSAGWEVAVVVGFLKSGVLEAGVINIEINPQWECVVNL